MKKIIASLLAVCLAVLLSACAFSETEELTRDNPFEESEMEDDEAVEEEEDKGSIPRIVQLREEGSMSGKKIGFTISQVESDEWGEQLVLAVQTIGEYYGADVNCLNAERNIETQIRDIEGFTVDEYDMIFIDAVSPDGAVQAIAEAKEEGVPAISCYNECNADVETYVTWDAYAGGKKFAEYFIDYVKEHNAGDTIKVVELSNYASERGKERYKALHEAFDASDIDFEIVGQYETEGNREYAYTAIEKLEEPCDYIISDVDNGAFGAGAALIAEGNTTTKVFSMSGYGLEPFTALYEEDSNYTAFLNIDPWVLAATMYDAAFNCFSNQTNDKTINIESYMVDSSNVSDFWTFEEEEE